MRQRLMTISAAFAIGLTVLPLATAKAQYYAPPPCSPFPLFWPFCVAGAIVGAAAMIVTAPFGGLAGPPAYYGPPPFYPPPPGYFPPRNYPPPSYPPPH
ncbi:MAG TPA: hypothetical protein VFQ82_01560 [Stellaceae bacterium]|jgi:hypothetical protein|nr:hypothetical protein [Stellaceae bacterium]